MDGTGPPANYTPVSKSILTEDGESCRITVQYDYGMLKALVHHGSDAPGVLYCTACHPHPMEANKELYVQCTKGLAGGAISALRAMIRNLVESAGRLRYDATGMGEHEATVEGETPELLNALRRIMMGEIPTIAIDSATVHVNTSPLPDPLILHRLALLPLRCESVGTEGISAFDNMTILLDSSRFVESTPRSHRLVTTHELVLPVGVRVAEPFFDTQHRCPEGACTCMDLLGIGPGQRFHAEMKLKVGTGRKHIKHSPVTTCTPGIGDVPRMRFEATGQLTTREIFDEAVKILNVELQRMATVLCGPGSIDAREIKRQCRS